MKKIIVVFMMVLFLSVITGCGSSYSDSSSSESFIDYFKREDPGLYNDLKSRYYGLD